MRAMRTVATLIVVIYGSGFASTWIGLTVFMTARRRYVPHVVEHTIRISQVRQRWGANSPVLVALVYAVKWPYELWRTAAGRHGDPRQWAPWRKTPPD